MSGLNKNRLYYLAIQAIRIVMFVTPTGFKPVTFRTGI